VRCVALHHGRSVSLLAKRGRRRGCASRCIACILMRGVCCRNRVLNDIMVGDGIWGGEGVAGYRPKGG
jgi:hypothetical protein